MQNILKNLVDLGLCTKKRRNYKNPVNEIFFMYRV